MKTETDWTMPDNSHGSCGTFNMIFNLEIIWCSKIEMSDRVSAGTRQPTRLTGSLAFRQSQASLGEVLGEFRNFLETVRNFQIPSQLIKQTLINEDAQKNECNLVKTC